MLVSTQCTDICVCVYLCGGSPSCSPPVCLLSSKFFPHCGIQPLVKSEAADSESSCFSPGLDSVIQQSVKSASRKRHEELLNPFLICTPRPPLFTPNHVCSLLVNLSRSLASPDSPVIVLPINPVHSATQMCL